MKPEYKEIDGQKWMRIDGEFEKKRYLYGHIISIVGIIILLVFSVLFFKFVFKEQDAFVRNPLLYGAQQIEDSEKLPVSCQCFTKNSRYTFNATSFYIPQVDQTITMKDQTNFSALLKVIFAK